MRSTSSRWAAAKNPESVAGGDAAAVVGSIAEWGARDQQNNCHQAEERPNGEPAIAEEQVGRDLLHFKDQQDGEQGNTQQNIFADPIELTFHPIQTIVVRHVNGPH
jgi:hypothetical protein